MVKDWPMIKKDEARVSVMEDSAEVLSSSLDCITSTPVRKVVGVATIKDKLGEKCSCWFGQTPCNASNYGIGS